MLGALIGGALLYLSHLGYVAMAYRSGICTIKGYNPWKKGISKGIVISSIWMVITVFLVNQIDLAMKSLPN